jgi:hypothetical protein
VKHQSIIIIIINSSTSIFQRHSIHLSNAARIYPAASSLRWKVSLTTTAGRTPNTRKEITVELLDPIFYHGDLVTL